MRNKGNGQFRRFLFRAGGTAHDHRVFVGVKLIVPAALNHKHGFKVKGDKPPAFILRPVDVTPARPANAHTAHPRFPAEQGNNRRETQTASGPMFGFSGLNETTYS